MLENALILVCAVPVALWVAGAVYYDVGLGWQHWLSPQIEMRPEFTWYRSSHPSFNDGTDKSERVFAGDIIAHF